MTKKSMGAETDKEYKVPLKSKDSLRYYKDGTLKEKKVQVEGIEGERGSIPSSLNTEEQDSSSEESKDQDALSPKSGDAPFVKQNTKISSIQRTSHETSDNENNESILTGKENKKLRGSIVKSHDSSIVNKSITNKSESKRKSKTITHPPILKMNSQLSSTIQS